MHNLLETYLSEVERSLRLLPKRRRNEELREIRQHLQNAVAVYREQGQSEDEAAQSAIAQFGQSDDLGQNIVQAWRRGQAIRRRDLGKSAVCALLLVFMLPRLLSPLAKPFALQAFNAHEFQLVTILFDLPFLLAGMINGIVLPRQAVAGTGLGTGSFCLYRMSVMLFLNLQVMLDRHFSSFMIHANLLLFAGTMVTYWGTATLAAILGAWIGSRARGRQARLTVLRP